MIRTKTQSEPNAIFTADWHLREDQPVCRTDVYEEAMWKKVDFISALQKKYNCPVIHAGDLLHEWKSSPSLLTKISQHLPDQFYTVFGNHDLPQHNLDLAFKSGVYTLGVTNQLKILDGCHWAKTPSGDPSFVINDRRILVWHIMTYQGKEPWPGCTDPKANKLLRTQRDYDVILTGDNHQPFVEEYENRLLINPGSLCRMTAAQIDFKPRVYLYFSKTNTIQPVYLPVEDNVISREHIENKEQRSARIDAFINSLNDDWDAGLSFENNLQQFAKKNKVRQSVMDIIYKSLER